MPQVKEDFDRALARGCQVPGCDHRGHGALAEIYLHQRCHAGAGLEACYRDGLLLLACQHCKTPVALVAVAQAKTL